MLTTQSDNSAITITNLTDSRIQIFLNEVEYITEIDSGLLIPCFEGDTTILRIETENHSLTCPSDTQLNEEVIK